MTDFCQKLDQDLISKNTIDTRLSGSTGIITVVFNKRVVVANVGDSMSILIKDNKKNYVCKNLNRELVPSLEVERRRIIQSGGDVHPFIRS